MPTVALDQNQFEQIAAYRRHETGFALISVLPVLAFAIGWLSYGFGLPVFLVSLVTYGAINTLVHLRTKRRILAVTAGAPISPRTLDVSLGHRIDLVLAGYPYRPLLGSTALFSLVAIGSFLSLIQTFLDVEWAAPKRVNPFVAFFGLVTSLSLSIVFIRELRRRKRINSEHR